MEGWIICVKKILLVLVEMTADRRVNSSKSTEEVGTYVRIKNKMIIDKTRLLVQFYFLRYTNSGNTDFRMPEEYFETINRDFKFH